MPDHQRAVFRYKRDPWATTGSSLEGCQVSVLLTLQEVPDQKWRERYSEGQKLRARIIYVDANIKKVNYLSTPCEEGLRVHLACP